MYYLDYIPKLMPIASYNMIKIGEVIQGELTWSVLKISGVIKLLLFARESAYLFGTCTCIRH